MVIKCHVKSNGDHFITADGKTVAFATVIKGEVKYFRQLSSGEKIATSKDDYISLAKLEK